jgi:hypothetical protein
MSRREKRPDSQSITACSESCLGQQLPKGWPRGYREAYKTDAA